jgi:hypothetical protein
MHATLDVITWNVNGFAAKQQPELLGGLPWQLCLIQEGTTPEALARLAVRAGADAWCSARERLSAEDALRAPPYVCAVLVREPVELLRWSCLDGVPSPERTLVCELSLGGRTLTAASLALPPASRPAWGREGKAKQCARIVRFLVRSGEDGASRYDFLRASPELACDDAAYMYDEARVAGSDHALVRATLVWS